MSEWLTFGQMIDKLKVNEISVNDRGDHFKRQSYGFVACEVDGSYMENNTLKLNDVTLDMKWRIIPKYVTFEEAMKVHKEERKTVVFHEGNGNYYEFREGEYQMFGFMHDYKFTLMHLIKGQWSIED